jgi:hypothetical protein
MTASQGSSMTNAIAAVCLFISMIFVYRSFYGMRIETESPAPAAAVEPAG